MTERLASGPQLWRLNKEGLLRISDRGDSLTAAVAHGVIADLAAGPTAPSLELDEPSPVAEGAGTPADDRASSPSAYPKAHSQDSPNPVAPGV